MNNVFVFINRLELEFEPLFACMALYDARERKKVNSRMIKSLILNPFSVYMYFEFPIK